MVLHQLSEPQPAIHLCNSPGGPHKFYNRCSDCKTQIITEAMKTTKGLCFETERRTPAVETGRLEPEEKLKEQMKLMVSGHYSLITPGLTFSIWQAGRLPFSLLVTPVSPGALLDFTSLRTLEIS